MANWLGSLMHGWPAWAVGISIVVLVIGWLAWTFANNWAFTTNRKPFKGEKNGKE